MTKKNKEHVISARYTEDEYLDVLLKITDAHGNKMMSAGKFSKIATLEGKVTITDNEIDKYKVFIASKISNNINQIAKKLNTAYRSDNVSETTYVNLLNEMEQLNNELNNLLEPLK